MAAEEWSHDARIEEAREAVEQVLDRLAADWWPSSSAETRPILVMALLLSQQRLTDAQPELTDLLG